MQQDLQAMFTCTHNDLWLFLFYMFCVIDGIIWQFMSWLCWLPLIDLDFCYPTVASWTSSRVRLPFHLILISNHFVLMTDDANGFRLIHQHCDFQYVHYVDGRESSATIIWRHDPAAAAGSYDAVVAVAGMILSSLASFSLVPRVRASPVYAFVREKTNKMWEIYWIFIKKKLRRVTSARQNRRSHKFRNDQKQSVGRLWLCGLDKAEWRVNGDDRKKWKFIVTLWLYANFPFSSSSCFIFFFVLLRKLTIPFSTHSRLH